MHKASWLWMSPVSSLYVFVLYFFRSSTLTVWHEQLTSWIFELARKTKQCARSRFVQHKTKQLCSSLWNRLSFPSQSVSFINYDIFDGHAERTLYPDMLCEVPCHNLANVNRQFAPTERKKWPSCPGRNVEGIRWYEPAGTLLSCLT